MQHVLTKTYSILRGESTDSKFVRPANVADKLVNMMRLSDGTFAPRRGYQVRTNTFGGLGNGIYQNDTNEVVEPLCIHKDGNLYGQSKGTLTISFDDPNNLPESYVTYELYIDPDLVSDTQTCDFDPYLVMADSALIDDCMKFRMKHLKAYSGVVVGTGSTTYTAILAGFPLTPGSILMTDGTLTIQDDAIGGFIGDTGVGTNTINYTTGAYTVTFSGVTGAQVASYRTTLQEQFDVCVGKGYGVANPYSIDDLIVELELVEGVTVATTGDTSKPVAFIDIAEETIIIDDSSVVLEWVYWTSTNRTLAKTFSGLSDEINNDDFRIAVFAPYENVVYIASKFDEVQKYDGQTVYRAGMPQGATPSAAASGGGTGVDAGSHDWYITYEQTDSPGRLVEGRLSVGGQHTVAGGGEDVNVTVTNLLEGSGWNTGCAITDGVQATVNTITVDNGSAGVHSLQVGDKAYFFDTSGSAYVTRGITAVTATSITVDGATVSVADNAPISNNLKINIYRIAVGETTPYLLVTLPNDSYSANQVYLDSTSDTDLVDLREYPIPARQPDPPPKVGVVATFNNQVIYTDDPDSQDLVSFSEAGQPEYVSAAFNNFIVPSNDDDVTGAGVAGSTLVILKNQSLYAVTGDLITSQFTVVPIASGSNIGTVSHHTVKSVGNLLYFLHTNGVYAIAETQLFPTDEFGSPVPLSRPIDKVFRQDALQEDRKFVLKRATATNYTKEQQYLLYLPAEDTDGPKAGNDHSRVFMYDYEGKNWFEWTRVNAAGGWYVLKDDLYWQERKRLNNTINAKEYRQHRKYRLIDQVDHVTPVRVTWQSSWEDMGQPKVRKKFVRAALLFDNVSALYQQNIPTLCFYSYKDWVENRISTRVDVMQKINSSKWDTDSWSWLEWSGYQDSFITIALKGGTVAKSLAIGLQLNQINTTFRLQGFQLEISPDFRRTIVR